MNGAYTPALAREISAEGIILVEAYNYRVATGSERTANANCGGGPIRMSFGGSGRELRTYRPAREGVVAYMYVWTR
jgi:hypothetical protein